MHFSNNFRPSDDWFTHRPEFCPELAALPPITALIFALTEQISGEWDEARTFALQVPVKLPTGSAREYHVHTIKQDIKAGLGGWIKK